MLSETSQREKDKYYILSLTCGILKKTKTSEYDTKKAKQTQIQRTSQWLPMEQRKGAKIGARD